MLFKTVYRRSTILVVFCLSDDGGRIAASGLSGVLAKQRRRASSLQAPVVKAAYSYH
jgi:hypothetical protein